MSSRVSTLSVAVLAFLGISMPRISCIPTSPDTDAPGAIVDASGALEGDANSFDANHSDRTLAFNHSGEFAEGTWEFVGGTASKSIIVVSDHGTGSTTYTDLLASHPCVMLGGEPFGSMGHHRTTLNWATHADEGAYFDLATGRRNQGVEGNTKLATNLAAWASHKGWSLNHVDRHIKHTARDHVHKVGDITEYFQQVTQYVCEAMPKDVKEQCNNRCAVVYKMFPSYVGGNSNMAVNAGGYDTNNPRALDVWSQLLDAMKSSPHIAMALIERDEQDRELSNFQRFAATGSLFDCSLNLITPNNNFFKVARNKLSGDPTVEPVTCLSSKDSTMKCLGKVLRSSGLDLDKEAVEDQLEREEATREARASRHSKGPSTLCDHGEMLVKKHSGVQVVKKRNENFTS